MADKNSAKVFFERATRSSLEARGRAMAFSAGGIAELFALLTSEGFSADSNQKWLLILSGVMLALSIAFGVLNSFADVQWSYLKATLMNSSSDTQTKAKEKFWHRCKRFSEYLTQAHFVVGIILASILLV